MGQENGATNFQQAMADQQDTATVALMKDWVAVVDTPLGGSAGV